MRCYGVHVNRIDFPFDPQSASLSPHPRFDAAPRFFYSPAMGVSECELLLLNMSNIPAKQVRKAYTNVNTCCSI